MLAGRKGADGHSVEDAAWRMPGPTGLGTAAALLSRTAGTPSAYTHREWGDGKAPPLYVPAVERADDALAAEVNARLGRWAAEQGC